MFSKGQHDEAINIFLELDTNPAKVVALYPKAVSGRLHVPRDEWISLFGGKKSLLRNASGSVDSHPAEASETAATDTGSPDEGVVAADANLNTSEPDALRTPAAEAVATSSEVSGTVDSTPTPGTPRWFGELLPLSLGVMTQ
jgi:hypothetical protein